MNLNITPKYNRWSLFTLALTETSFELDIVAIVIEVPICLETLFNKLRKSFATGSSCTDFDIDNWHRMSIGKIGGMAI